MAKSEAKVVVTGRVAFAGIKNVGSSRVYEISVPVEKRRKDKETGEWSTVSTAWYKVQAWNDKADGLESLGLGKGDTISVTGKLEVGEYTDKTGKVKPSLEIAFPEIEILEQKARNDDL
jgi:single-stranded DNA-binding protein